MQLEYKSDWEETKERYEAWWAHECFGRCAISVTAPRKDPPDGSWPPLPDRVEDRWFDHEYIAASNEYRLSHTFFGGEAVPLWHPGYPGWSTIPCFLGSAVDLDETTGWVYPIIQDGALTDHDYHNLVIDPENCYWKQWLEMLRFSVDQAKGKAIPTTGAFGGAGDTLAALRDTGNLLTDLIECPDYVREFDLYLMKQWTEVFDVFHSIVHEAAEGSSGWFPLWSPGKTYASQNDFAYMISPEMFHDIFLSSIEMQTNYLDHTIHHVDGIGNFNHVDALCELPRLHALQIGPGEGKPSALHYMDLLKKVQAKGKNLWISLHPSEIETALENLSAKGLFIDTYCASEDEARALIKNCEKWSRNS